WAGGSPFACVAATKRVTPSRNRHVHVAIPPDPRCLCRCSSDVCAASATTPLPPNPPEEVPHHDHARQPDRWWQRGFPLVAVPHGPAHADRAAARTAAERPGRTV